MSLQELKAERAHLVRKAKKIKADAGDDISDEQMSSIEGLMADIKELDGEIEVAEKRASVLKELDDAAGAQPRKVHGAAASETPKVEAVREAWRDDPALGFKSPKAFFSGIIEATKTGKMSPQLGYLAAAGSDEQQTQSDPFGGFLVPEAFATGVKQVGVEADPTASRVTNVPMGAPVVNINARVDKDHSSSVSGGLTVGRRVETQQGSSSQMSFEQIKLTANSLVGINYVSDELMRDSAVSVAALIANGFRDEFASKIMDEKIRGTGVGELTGVLNAACLIEVAKESMQAADTINGTNIKKMRQQCYNYGNAIWLVNHDTYIQLCNAHTTLTNDDHPLFVHGNGTDVPDTLLGRPVFFSEYASALGDKGDIILGDWSQYLYGTYGGMEQASSIHVRFLNHENTFRFSMRNDGAPWWNTALTPKNGANTLSPFVTLAERA